MEIVEYPILLDGELGPALPQLTRNDRMWLVN
jgi:hypothetical protein